MTVKGGDSSVLLSIKLILSPAEAKLDIDNTANTINPPINYGEITDVYISCNNDKFQVILFSILKGTISIIIITSLKKINYSKKQIK